MKIAPARQIAFQILRTVASTDAHSDDLLRTRRMDALSPQDRALVTTLVLGTLRWQIKLDALIRPLLSRPDTRLSTVVETTLRLGAFQLLYLDRIPAYAAINDSVELAKQSGDAPAARMVNAVLRKVAKLPRAIEPSELETAQQIATAFAHPLWLVDSWSSFYGLDIAAAICRFNQEPAAISIRLLDPDAETALNAEGVQLQPGEFLTSARRVISGDIVRGRPFLEGRIRIQDEASQLVAELAGTGNTILDTCAAPGGKTAILAERNPRAAITAWDISERRLDAMRRILAPSGDRISLEIRDASEAKLQQQYDLILCDVPCSGTGTIARNPEIRFRINNDEIARQHQRQVQILSAALAGLLPRGRLLYSTCSLEPEENEAVVAESLEKIPGFTHRPLHHELEALRAKRAVTDAGALQLNTSALKDGFLRTIPGIHNCDGFFAALITRD